MATRLAGKDTRFLPFNQALTVPGGTAAQAIRPTPTAILPPTSGKKCPEGQHDGYYSEIYELTGW